MARRPFKLRELLQKLRPYGIKMLEKAGKGSECILLKPAGPGSRQGPQFPIKNHGPATEIYIPVIRAILRRFNIPENEFWD